MTSLTHDDQIALLRDLAAMGGHGRAEGESRERFPKTFFPVAEHARAFDPEVVLVVGPRGSGKTELFRAVIELGLLPAIARHAPGVRLPPLEANRTAWISGYPIGAGFPDARGLRNFVNRRASTPGSLLELWLTYLVRTLGFRLDRSSQEALLPLTVLPSADVMGNCDKMRALGDLVMVALDRFDEALQRNDSRVFIAYDELDTLGAPDWATMSAGIQGLVAFWASYARRWRRIRAKIFIRSDLFRRHATVGGADLAKLAANRAELSWGDKSLYGMLLKRIVNASPGLERYCDGGRIRFLLDEDLGVVPVVAKGEHVRPLVNRMVGPYMGANLKNGLVFRWLLDHVRDGQGNALPRPLVRLIEEAAEREVSVGGRARLPRLLTPVSLRVALDVVSEEHVTQAIDEWPWLPGVRERLSGDQVPWDRPQQVERRLANSWEKSWGAVEGTRPPVEEPDEFVRYLLEIGLFRERSDGRIDVPDLFLAGLGLKRKGGVRRR